MSLIITIAESNVSNVKVVDYVIWYKNLLFHLGIELERCYEVEVR